MTRHNNEVRKVVRDFYGKSARGSWRLLLLYPGYEALRPLNILKIRVMDERRGVQGMVWSLLSHSGRRQLSQFVV